MSHIKFSLTYILFWVILILTGLLVENVAIFTNAPREGFEMTTFYVISFLLLFVSVLFFVVERKKNKIKFKWILSILLLTFLVISLVRIWSMPEVTNYASSETGRTFELVISLNDKIIYSIQIFFTISLTYLLLGPYREKCLNQKRLIWMYWLYVIATFISIGVSIWLDFDVYKSIVTTDTIDVASIKACSSYFTNSNFYGMCLMIGILCLCVIQLHKPTYFAIPLMVVIFVFEIFSCCDACILISIVVIALYIIYACIVGFKHHWLKTLISLIVSIVAIIALIIVLGVLGNQGNEIIAKFNNYFYYHLSPTRYGIDFMRDRGDVWEIGFKALKDDPLAVVFGYGFGVDSRVMHAFASLYHELGPYDILTAHSAFIQMLLKGGIIGTVIYGGALLYFIACCIYLLIKKKWRNAYIYFLCFSAIIVHGIVESTFFFEANTKGIVITVLFFIPAVADAKNETKKGKQEIENIKYSSYFYKKMDSHLMTQMFASIFFGIFLCSFTLITSQYSYYGDNFQVVANVLIGLLGFSIFVPYFMTMLYKKASRRRFIVRFILNTSLFAILNVLGVIFAFINKWFTLIPIVYFASLILPFIVYFIFTKGSFKDWIKDSLLGSFKLNMIPDIFAVIGGLAISFTLSALLSESLFTQMLIVVANIIFYFSILFLTKSKEKIAISQYLNEIDIAKTRQYLF